MRRNDHGMTLVEVLVASLVSLLALAGIVSGYIFANTSAEKFGLSLSATAQASQWMEQMRSAQWDISSFPVVDNLTTTNFSNEVVTLESPGNGTNVIYATNFATITMISTNPPLRRIRVDCVWIFNGFHESGVYTNTIETCRAPNQ
jgi:prepilin-type N-terminal cleavage/methylation domain-containing protein